ncbi:MAG TPA: YoaK family protein [Actinospica sp.]|nr:YoaK family protein [Actinospica sp.]
MTSENLQQAWRTIVPERGARFGPLPPLMLLLTLVTGFVDAYSYLALGHVFVANMTGNVVFSGFAIAGTPGFSLVASVVALAAFAVGALCGGRVSRLEPAHRGRMLSLAVVIEGTIMLAAYLVVALAESPDTSSAVRYTVIVLLGLAMGTQNAAARALAVPDLTTTVLTQTITGTSADSRAAGGPGGKAGRRLLSIAAMFLGATVGALLIKHGHAAASLLCAVGLLAVAAAAVWRTRGSEEEWTKP